MTQDSSDQPVWNPVDKLASLLAWGEWLHDEARSVFLADGTHGQMLFLFDDAGIASISPIPPNTAPQQLAAGVRQAVREHNLYGVITIAEAWTYVPRSPKDHTAFQLLDGEMGVADLRPDDKTEALMVRMESRDGEHLTWLDTIVRKDGTVTLGAGARLPKEKCLKLTSYFE